MAGGYTHLTLVRSAITSVCNRKYESGVLPWQSALADVLEIWSRYAYLGGVSPDYPYLGFDAEWADRMHKGGTDRMASAAMPAIYREKKNNSGGRVWQQQFAWLLGLAAHVVTDVVIHPVVNLKVGKYEANKVRHRLCEMNQDVWIYRRRINLDLHYSDNMKTEVKSCGRRFDLEDAVEDLWAACMETAYGERPGDHQIDKWHAAFQSLVDFAENGCRIPFFSRHLVDGAVAYPDFDDAAHSEFVTNLLVPLGDDLNADGIAVESGQPMAFDAIFDRALEKTQELWDVLAFDLFERDMVGNAHLTAFKDWNLDTGADNVTGRLSLW